MVRIGEETSDVSYFLATALKPEIRRLHEMDLLKKFHEIMLANSLTTADFNSLLNRYRVHLIYPFEADRNAGNRRHDEFGQQSGNDTTGCACH
jgi:hypothetical protein